MGARGDESAMNLEGVATQLSLAFLEDTQRRRAPLSLPNACRPTPIATTAPSFSICLNTDGATSVRLVT